MSRLKVYASPAEFLNGTNELLQTDEARYGLIYGIARLTAVNPHHYGEGDPWFATVNDRDVISALAWRTPPHLVGMAWHVFRLPLKIRQGKPPRFNTEPILI